MSDKLNVWLIGGYFKSFCWHTENKNIFWCNKSCSRSNGGISLVPCHWDAWAHKNREDCGRKEIQCKTFKSVMQWSHVSIHNGSNREEVIYRIIFKILSFPMTVLRTSWSKRGWKDLHLPHANRRHIHYLRRCFSQQSQVRFHFILAH